jgi:hypothetical protein
LREKMGTYNIQIPLMPKPEEFGIANQDWADSEIEVESMAKIRAYKEAVEAWKQAIGNFRAP